MILDGTARGAAFEALGSPMQAAKVRAQRWYRPLSPMEGLQRTYVLKGCQQMELMEKCAPTTPAAV